MKIRELLIQVYSIGFTLLDFTHRLMFKHGSPRYNGHLNKSSYNVLSGRKMLNVSRKDGIFVVLSYFNAGPGCFVELISASRLDIVNRNYSYKEKYVYKHK